jgi:hypothetical protein
VRRRRARCRRRAARRPAGVAAGGGIRPGRSGRPGGRHHRLVPRCTSVAGANTPWPMKSATKRGGRWYRV